MTGPASDWAWDRHTSTDTRRRRRKVPQPGTGSGHEPSIRAIPFGLAATNAVVPLLTHPERLQLAGIATQLRLPPREIVFREDAAAHCLFIIGHGSVKAFRDLRSGRRRVMGFLFARDVVGLAECGRYVNTVQTITDALVYRLPLDQLMELLYHDSTLELKFLCKVTHELRESLRQNIVLSRRDAVGRVAMFLQMLEKRNPDSGSSISIPMSRSDIAGFLGLSLEAVIRASRRLERRGLVAYDGIHAARILDRRGFEELASNV